MRRHERRWEGEPPGEPTGGGATDDHRSEKMATNEHEGERTRMNTDEEEAVKSHRPG